MRRSASCLPNTRNSSKTASTDFVTRGTDIARVRALRGTPRRIRPRRVAARWRSSAGSASAFPEALRRHGARSRRDCRSSRKALARALVPEPFTAAPCSPRRARRVRQRSAQAAGAAAGSCAARLVPALAWQEAPGHARHRAHRSARDRRSKAAIRLSGTKRYVAGAAGADVFVVAAQIGNGPRPRVRRSRRAGRDARAGAARRRPPFGTLALDDAVVPRERVAATGAAAQRGAGARARPCGRDRGRGALRRHEPRARNERRLHEDARAVRQADRQLPGAAAPRGRSLHPAAARVRGARGWPARARCATARRGERAAIASRIKARCSEAGLRITREAIQIHGAIGFTDEYDAGLYLKRALVLGGVARQRERSIAAAMRSSTLRNEADDERATER